jgi:predicted dehydrogenase
MRFHPALRHLRALLEQRVIGDVVAVRAEIGEFLPSAHPYEDYRDSYAGRADLGGGVILSHSHELDYLRWLFGVPRRIFAVGGRLSSLEIDVEDTAGILMECVVNDRPVPVALSQDFLQRPARETCQIVGDRGTIRVDFRGPALEMFDECGRLADGQSFAGFRRNDPFLSELRHVLACFRGEETPLVTLRDAGETLRVALAARESMASGRVVELS